MSPTTIRDDALHSDGQPRFFGRASDHILGIFHRANNLLFFEYDCPASLPTLY
jgi:hypothetical protein